jgi:hypothetical protein
MLFFFMRQWLEVLHNDVQASRVHPGSIIPAVPDPGGSIKIVGACEIAQVTAVKKANFHGLSLSLERRHVFLKPFHVMGTIPKI